MKKIAAIAMSACVGLGVFAMAACNQTTDSAFITTAIARPTSSGTRGAFDELVINSAGEALTDKDFASVISTQESTGSVITAVSQNTYTLGYISLGSVSANADSIKAVKVEGVEATVGNITNGTYKLSRPFNIVYQTGSTLSDLAQNFISYINSSECQDIINVEYIGVSTSTEEYVPYSGTMDSLTLGGSTSVGPLMEQIAEAYEKLNPGVTITIQGGGSGTGIAQVGKDWELGMASRELKESEKASVSAIKIADDGIAIIVNKDCKLTNVTMDQLYDLYVNGTKIACE